MQISTEICGIHVAMVSCGKQTALNKQEPHRPAVRKTGWVQSEGKPREAGAWWSVLHLALTVSQDNDIQRAMPATSLLSAKPYENFCSSKL